MTWFADLSPYYSASSDSRLLAVGWLSRGHPFTTGAVSEGFFEKLCEMLVNPWSPAYPAGSHACDLCRFSGRNTGRGTAKFKGFTVSAASSASLFVPGEGVVYVAPSSIAHYIDAHGYQPPAEFCRAV